MPLVLFFLVSFSFQAQAETITTNAAVFNNAPKWLKSVRARKVTNRIQTKLEWSTRRVNVYFYNDQKKFAKKHGQGDQARAVTVASEKKQEIHLGPKVSDKNFDEVFGHELVHVIFYQKYRGAIPKWLEEGLANLLAKKLEPNYKWLAKQKPPSDVRDIVHLYNGSSKEVRYHYQVSLALAKMINKKCDMQNLLRLSVERKMQDYIKTYCEINDLNQAFNDWIKKKAKKNGA